jgi:hypothetical protein
MKKEGKRVHLTAWPQTRYCTWVRVVIQGGAAWKTRHERKREREHANEWKGENGPRKSSAFQGQTSGVFIADRQTDRQRLMSDESSK